MIRQVINYIKNDDFEVKFNYNYLNIVNYLTINYMENEKISVNYKGGSLIVKGNNLIITKLLDNEILIKGKFTNIEIRRDNE